MPAILYFTDPVGITAGYQALWDRVSVGQGQAVSLYRLFDKNQLLHYSGNRKAPGYSLDPKMQHRVRDAVASFVDRYKPRVIVTSDPATLFLCATDIEADWSWLTIDNVRGSQYNYGSLPFVVTYPFTAYYREVRERDIAAANDGFATEEEFVEAQESEQDTADADSNDEKEHDRAFYTPIVTKVHIGRFTIINDWRKVMRLAGVTDANHL